MSKNLPVTDIEYRVQDGRPLVSMTDIRGRITYVNPSFIEVSGFSEKELVGSSHNLVRHPDMPSATFADLWQTLKAGLCWTGVIKNRRKNGDHYWMSANIMPVLESGQTTGYMSILTKPARQQVESVGTLHRRGIDCQTRGAEVSEYVLLCFTRLIQGVIAAIRGLAARFTRFGGFQPHKEILKL